MAQSCEPHRGFWGISQALTDAQSDHARLLLDKIQAAVGSGEDLTAAFLLAHGQLQRHGGEGDAESAGGSRVVAMRQTNSPGTLELAWVGKSSALMLRKAHPISIANDKSRHNQHGKNMLFETKRLDGLGGSDKSRPLIDRNLINVQRHDVVILSGGKLDLCAYQNIVSEAFRGFGNLEYKARKLQAALEPVIDGSACLCFVQIS